MMFKKHGRSAIGEPKVAHTQFCKFILKNIQKYKFADVFALL